MNGKQHKDIDEVFRKALANADNEPGFDVQHWDALDSMLDGKKKTRKVIFWRTLISSAAAMLLVALGWWYLAPQTAQNANNAQPVVRQQPNGTGTPQRGDTIVSWGNNSALLSAPIKKRGNTDAFELQKTDQQQLSDKNITESARGDLDDVNIVKSVLKTDEKGMDKSTQLADNVALPVNAQKPDQPIVTTDKPNAAADMAKDEPPLLDMPGIPVAARKGDNETTQKPRLAISIMASADMNGVSSFNSVGTGKNVGALLSVRFNKFTVSTGAYYSYKPYSMPFSAYSPHSSYKFNYAPVSVVADCRMLDIPLNIDYQLYSKNRNTFSIGTGLSSYLMLRENYLYNYNSAVTGVTSYEVKNPDQYLFSAVNFQVNYRRQINSKLGINVMPYVKVPLANMGYSQVRLQTVGVAVGFNWNINTLPKPK